MYPISLSVSLELDTFVIRVALRLLMSPDSPRPSQLLHHQQFCTPHAVVSLHLTQHCSACSIVLSGNFLSLYFDNPRLILFHDSFHSTKCTGVVYLFSFEGLHLTLAGGDGLLLLRAHKPQCLLQHSDPVFFHSTPEQSILETMWWHLLS